MIYFLRTHKKPDLLGLFLFSAIGRYVYFLHDNFFAIINHMDSSIDIRSVNFASHLLISLQDFYIGYLIQLK